MIERIFGWARRGAPLLVAASVFVGGFGGSAAQAQEAPAGEESKGDPVPGYLGVLLLVIGVMFAVGKSARR